MPQIRLSNSDFLNKITSLLQTTTTSGHGSIFLSQKPVPAEYGSSSQILIRASNGATKQKPPHPDAKVTKDKLHKDKPIIKFATVIEMNELEEFYAKYAEVCKRGMEGLRKRDKKKAKEKAKQKKAKKTGASA